LATARSYTKNYEFLIIYDLVNQVQPKTIVKSGEAALGKIVQRFYLQSYCCFDQNMILNYNNILI